MLRNKDRQLAGKARVQSRAIADVTADVDIDVQNLVTAGQDFSAWATSLTDEELIREIPKLTESLEHICLRAVEVQKDAARAILEVYAARETLEKLAIRKANRGKEGQEKCQEK